MIAALSRMERDELNDALSEALNGSRKPSRESARRAIELIEAADAAGRTWPSVVRDEALERYCFNSQKSISKREAVVLVSHDGRVIGKTVRVGRKVARPDGSTAFDQALFSEMSWDEVAQWARLILTQIDGLQANLSMVNRTFELRVRAPESFGPGDAAAALGTTVAEWIERAAS